jgi:hypothetical protein
VVFLAGFFVFDDLVADGAAVSAAVAMAAFKVSKESCRHCA